MCELNSDVDSQVNMDFFRKCIRNNSKAALCLLHSAQHLHYLADKCVGSEVSSEYEASEQLYALSEQLLSLSDLVKTIDLEVRELHDKQV